MRQPTTAEVRFDEHKAASFGPVGPSILPFWLSTSRLRSNFIAAAPPATEDQVQQAGNPENVGLGGNVDARHHCYLRRLGSSIDHFGASRLLASKQSRSDRTHCLPYRPSGRRMRVRISAHSLARSVGPLALGPLHFEDAQESISRKHGELGASAT